jgi:peptidoglycan/xylan/chitin deacetylase (PgdA/CDA1 family)
MNIVLRDKPFKKLIAVICITAYIFSACANANVETVSEKNTGIPDLKVKPAPEKTVSDAATILARPQVPILCYHDIRPIKPNASANAKVYTVSPEAFAEQMKTLADSGYQTILPDDLYNYLAYDDPLPPKPIMLTFDDTDVDQFEIGAAEMKKYNFKGVYFIMTISIGRNRYMSREQIKQLSDEGHAIEGHTWDHHMVTKYNPDDWVKQLTASHQTIEDITEKKVRYFAYPFGLWNKEAFAPLKERDIKLAFQLSTKRDSTNPLYTVRRMIVSGNWSTKGIIQSMNATFKK